MPLPPGSHSGFGSSASSELRWLLVSSAFFPVYPSVRLRAHSEQTGVCVTGTRPGRVHYPYLQCINSAGTRGSSAPGSGWCDRWSPTPEDCLRREGDPGTDPRWDVIVTVTQCLSTEEGLGWSRKAPQKQRPGGGVGAGNPGPRNSMGCASSSAPQKSLSEKLRKSAWLSEVCRGGEAGGRKLVSLSPAGSG